MIHWKLVLVGLMGCLAAACGGSNQPANDPNGSLGSAGASYGSGVPAPTGGTTGTSAGSDATGTRAPDSPPGSATPGSSAASGTSPVEGMGSGSPAH